jgi:hypothetical protein
MFTKTRIAIATLAVTGLALTAASPASAISRDYVIGEDAPTTGRIVDQPPVGTKGCPLEITGPDGKKTTITYPPGTKIKINGRSYECQDGEWVLADPIDSTGAAGSYVYSTDGGYYAEP